MILAPAELKDCGGDHREPSVGRSAGRVNHIGLWGEGQVPRRGDCGATSTKKLEHSLDKGERSETVPPCSASTSPPGQ